MSDGEIHGAPAIAGRLAEMTLEDALAMAQAFEASAALFFRALAERLAPDVRALALELAEEEERHGALLRRLAAEPDLQSHLRQSVRSPASTPTFQSFLTPVALADRPDEDALLDYARAREEIAREHYGYLAELAAPGPLQDLLRYLEREEQRHADDLSRRWGELFSVL